MKIFLLLLILFLSGCNFNSSCNFNSGNIVKHKLTGEVFVVIGTEQDLVYVRDKNYKAHAFGDGELSKMEDK